MVGYDSSLLKHSKYTGTQKARWSWRQESNLQPAHYKCAALPLSHASICRGNHGNPQSVSPFVHVREIWTKHCSKGEETGKLYSFPERILFSWFRALLSIATIALLPLTARSDCRLCITTESRNQSTLWVVFKHGGNREGTFAIASRLVASGIVSLSNRKRFAQILD